MPKFLLRSN